ncbi:MAG: hypothetical protein LBK52_02130 [Deltaproteobacteria bacterium]|jgi:hypothetical protein|nr:hypothetical protein [Deltaproteobacteria bacterium]
MTEETAQPEESFSWLRTWAFYLSCGFALAFYLFLASFFGYAAIYEPPREFTASLVFFLAGTSGLAAVFLTVRRKVFGPYWSLASLFPILIGLMVIDEKLAGPEDILLMALLFSVPSILLLGQLKTVKRLKVLGRGWLLGNLAYGYYQNKIKAFWYKFTLGPVILFDILAAINTIALIIYPHRLRLPSQIYFLINAFIMAVFGLILIFGKRIAGFYFQLGALLITLLLIICTFDLRHLTSSDHVFLILLFYFIASILMSIQLPYLKRLRKLGLKGPLKSAHFADCPALTDDKLARLNKAWARFNLSAIITIVWTCLDILYSEYLVRNIGGFAGNFLAVALFCTIPGYILAVVWPLKKRFQTCLEAIDINREIFDQALLRQKDEAKNISKNIASPSI